MSIIILHFFHQYFIKVPLFPPHCQFWMLSVLPIFKNLMMKVFLSVCISILNPLVTAKVMY